MTANTLSCTCGAVFFHEDDSGKWRKLGTRGLSTVRYTPGDRCADCGQKINFQTFQVPAERQP